MKSITLDTPTFFLGQLPFKYLLWEQEKKPTKPYADIVFKSYGSHVMER
jgi:hypothetical protein